jgi:hypothetical protein
MALSRLLNIVLLLLMVCAVAGFLSIQAEMTAVASAANDQETLVSSVSGKQPMVIAAELMPEDQELLILPEIPDLLVKNGRGVTELNATCQVDDGKLYAWQGLHRTRIWLFAIIADERPRMTIDSQATRHPPVTSPPTVGP